MFGQFVEPIVAHSRGPYHQCLAQELGERHFHKHIVNGEHPLAIGQLRVFLPHLQIIHKVHIAALGNGEIAPFHVQRRVGQHVYLPAETEVLLVVGHELQMIAQVAVHVDGILNVETIECHGILTYRTGERILQESHLVVVDVHIGKHIFQGGIQNVARLYQVVNARRVLSFHDLLLAMRVFAIDVLRDGLVDADGQNQFVVQRAYLHLVQQPLLFLELRVLQVHRLQVVHRQRNLLVFRILVVRVVAQRRFLFGGNHAFHQFYGRIILPRIFALSFRAHLHILQCAALGFQSDAQLRLSLARHIHLLTAKAQCRDGQRPSVVALNLEAPFAICRHHHMMSMINRTGKGNAVARCSIYHHAFDLLRADTHAHHQHDDH